jgi:hypothetical protein
VPHGTFGYTIQRVGASATLVDEYKFAARLEYDELLIVAPN